MENTKCDTSMSTGGESTTVTICIPTYEAESFIVRTLGFATGQTRRNIRILVSVDKSQDKTAAICRSIAETDQRIDVVQQKERLGWAGNLGELLRRVTTPYFFIYFHDDFISPHYCARMLDALENDSNAASANCSVALLGRTQHLVPAHTYSADTSDRMLEMLVHEQVPGALLRSMIRTERFDIADLLRKGIEGGEMFQAYCLHSAILLSGPAIGVTENLYTRWLRDNALTSPEKAPSIDRLIAVWSENLRRLWPFLQVRLQDPLALKLVRHTLLLRAIRIIACAPNTSSTALASFWRIAPFLPRIEDAPSLDSVHPVIAADVRRLRSEIAELLNQLPQSA